MKTFLKELKKRIELDQKVRIDKRSKFKDIRNVDKANTKWLKDYLTNHDFPSKADFTDQQLHEISFLIQHADHDHAFQESCLKKIYLLTKNEQYPKQFYAMLYDRVAVAKGKKQKFGTQCDTINGVSVSEKMQHSVSYTNALRKKYGLIPYTLKEYIKLMNGDESVLDKYL